jgi:hypothetical protein
VRRRRKKKSIMRWILQSCFWVGFWACFLAVTIGCVAPNGVASRPYGEDLVAHEEAAGMAWSSPGEAFRAGPPAAKMMAQQDAPMESEPVAASAGLERQIIYTAMLRLVVVSVADASNSVLALAKQAGGYLAESDAYSVTVRVPAAKFEPLLAQFEKLGEVVDRNVRASDVTEQMVELDIRLDNARRARERLIAHLEKSEKMEDTLKIEAELARVTLEIERIEGQLRFLRSQVAMSTIRVELNSRSPGRKPTDGLAVPFEWIGRLGDGLIAGAVEGLPRRPNFLTRGPSFEPPAEFLRYYSSDDLVEAMNADGVRIKVQRHSNYDSGAIAFWSKLARQALVESRSLAVSSESDLGDDRALLVGTRDVAGQRYGYLLLLARTPKRLYTFEAWGPAEMFDAQRGALEKSAKSLKR